MVAMIFYHLLSITQTLNTLSVVSLCPGYTFLLICNRGQTCKLTLVILSVSESRSGLRILPCTNLSQVKDQQVRLTWLTDSTKQPTSVPALSLLLGDGERGWQVLLTHNYSADIFSNKGIPHRTHNKDIFSPFVDIIELFYLSVSLPS